MAIGHITEDTADPENVIGGGVTYSGLAAKKLGLAVTIITKLPPRHRFIDTLKKRGISVLTLHTSSKKITTFTNKYDSLGNRQQILLDKQESITINDLVGVSDNLENAFFIVAPVIGEIDTKIIPYLARYGPVAITPQGYFRQIEQDGTITQKGWVDFEENLSFATITILSEEDIAPNGVTNKDLLDRIKASSPITIITQGEKGATVYKGEKVETQISAFPLKDGEIKDFTGAGDVFTASYITKFMNSGIHHEAAVFAAFFAAVKITRIGGTGVESIPDKKQLRGFINTHPSELKMFLKSNDAKEETLEI